MTNILPWNNQIDEVSDGDKFPVFDASNSGQRYATPQQILAYVQANISQTVASVPLNKQYAAPIATDFTITVVQGDTWLIVTPLAGYADGTIVLPSARSDGQVVSVCCTQAVADLTVSGNGASVSGAPDALSADGFFTMRYEAVTNIWYRVG